MGQEESKLEELNILQLQLAWINNVIASVIELRASSSSFYLPLFSPYINQEKNSVAYYTMIASTVVSDLASQSSVQSGSDIAKMDGTLCCCGFDTILLCKENLIPKTETTKRLILSALNFFEQFRKTFAAANYSSNKTVFEVLKAKSQLGTFQEVLELLWECVISLLRNYGEKDKEVLKTTLKLMEKSTEYNYRRYTMKINSV